MSDKSKNILLGVLIVGLVAMTVAYAALSTTLTISGTANVAEAKWDIHFENWTQNYPPQGVTGVDNTASQTATASMTPATKGTLISGLGINLAQPGDVAIYDFKIVNDGTINAKLSDFVQDITTNTGNTNDLTYKIVCGAEAAKGNSTLGSSAPAKGSDKLAAGNERTCRLTLQYNDANNNGVNATSYATHSDGSDQKYTGTARAVTISADWVWVQD